MDILHTFEVYQKQLDNLRINNSFRRPQVLRQYRMQFKGFTDTDIETLKEFLLDNNKKWFVARLLDHLDSFPLQLLRPMLNAAVNEPDPSFNNEFIKPCRRVFDYVDIRRILLDIFRSGDKSQKIGVLKSLYWARPTVHASTIREGESIYKQKGYDTFSWNDELSSFDEEFMEDDVVFTEKRPGQEEIYYEEVKTLIEAFNNTDDLELKYQICLRLPKKVDDFPEQLRASASQFLKKEEEQGIPENALELDKVQNIKSSFLRRLLLSIARKFKKECITLKHK